jgi:hypothetical protein
LFVSPIVSTTRRLGMKMIGLDLLKSPSRPFCRIWRRPGRPYIETCIAAFGPQRSIFESNFPVDKGT